MEHPPEYAHALMEALAPQARRNNIVGDLVEGHRDRAAEHGGRAADRWFVRQALGFVWAASALPGLAIATILTVRMLIDVGAPSADLARRAAVTTYVTMGLFVLSGFRLGRSTGRISGATVMAIGATVIGTISSYAMVFLCMAAAATIVHPSAAAWAGMREGLDIPAHVIAIIGVVLASLGATVARMLPKP
jgi:hypothetical protein